MTIETTDKQYGQIGGASRPPGGLHRGFHIFLSAALVLLSAGLLWAATTGSISGVLTDPSGAMIPGATVIAMNPATGSENKATTNEKGFYSFPSLPVGRYDVSADVPGFTPRKRQGIAVDADSKLQIDLTVQMKERAEEVTVMESVMQVETSSTQVGEVVTATSMTTVALNGRSFTDLMALQPGIVPMSTQTGDSIVMAGATVAIPPSGTLNPGNQSISGQREDANGFMINGADGK